MMTFNRMSTGVALLFIIIAMKPEACDRQSSSTANLKGQLLWIEGNRMPGPGVSLPEGKGVQREVHVFEATEKSQVSGEGSLFRDVMSKRVTVIYSNEDGYFEASLEPGKYSLFVKEPNGKYFAATMDDLHYCPVSIAKDQVAELEIRIDYEAFY